MCEYDRSIKQTNEQKKKKDAQDDRETVTHTHEAARTNAGKIEETQFYRWEQEKTNKQKKRERKKNKTQTFWQSENTKKRNIYFLDRERERD